MISPIYNKRLYRVDSSYYLWLLYLSFFFYFFPKTETLYTCILIWTWLIFIWNICFWISRIFFDNLHFIIARFIIVHLSWSILSNYRYCFSAALFLITCFFFDLRLVSFFNIFFSIYSLIPLLISYHLIKNLHCTRTLCKRCQEYRSEQSRVTFSNFSFKICFLRLFIRDGLMKIDIFTSSSHTNTRRVKMYLYGNVTRVIVITKSRSQNRDHVRWSWIFDTILHKSNFNYIITYI